MKSESQIQRDVMEELKWEATINAMSPAEIGVSVKNGVVTLTGIVDTYSKKMAAEKAAKKVGGVQAIANEVEVKLPGAFIRTDTEIAEAVLRALQWNTAIPDDKIKVKVEKGWVTLEGELEWEFQKRAAKNEVEDIMGVKGVSNLIKISSKSVTSEKVKEEINRAFGRNFYLDADKIKVQIDGNKAILTGEVRTLAEKMPPRLQRGLRRE